MKSWSPDNFAAASLRAWSVMATTLHVCKLDEDAALCAAAPSISNVPSGRASGLKRRTDLWANSVGSTAFSAKPFSGTSGASAPYRFVSRSDSSLIPLKQADGGEKFPALIACGHNLCYNGSRVKIVCLPSSVLFCRPNLGKGNTHLKQTCPKRIPFLATGAVAVMMLAHIPSANAQTVLQNFTGNFAGGSGSVPAGMNYDNLIPPDTMGAVGTNDFVQFINDGYSVYSKTGVLENTPGTSDNSFWTAAGISGTEASSIGDPHILFDPNSGRWFASEITTPGGQQVANQFLVAVSNDSNPLDGFKGYSYDANPATGSSALFADFDMLGINSQGIYVGANMFSGNTFTGQDFLTVSKSDLIAGAAAPISTLTYNADANTYGFGARPVVDQDNGGAAGSLGEKVLGLGNTTNAVIVDTLGGTTGAATLTQNATDTFGSATNGAGPAHQLGGNNTIDTGDNRFSSAIVKQNGIIYSTNTLADPTTGLADIHILGINAATNAVVLDQIISGTGKGTGGTNLDLYYPSLAINAAGNVVLGYSGSGPADYASAYAMTGVLAANGQSINFGNAIETAAGQGNYNVDFGTGTNRWGDYSATTIDPTNPNNFWTVQEFAIGTNEWGTQITEISMAAPVPEASTTVSFGLLLALGAGGVLRARAGKRSRQSAAA